jgi:hypothetical protein
MTDSPIRYARGRDKFDNRPETREAPDFGAFAKAILADRGKAKGEAWFSGPFNSDGRRCRENAQPRRWLPVDLDRIEPGILPDARIWFTRYSAFGYPTASSTAEAPRMRIVLELSREATRDECIRVGADLSRDLAEEFGEQVAADDSVYRNEQPVYMPLQGVQPFFFEGDVLDVDAALASAAEAAQPASEGAPGGAGLSEAERERIESLLPFVGGVADYEKWLHVGMCLHDETRGSQQGLALWDAWSRQASNYEAAACAAKWVTFKIGGGKSLGSLIYEATGKGWKDVQWRAAWGELLIPSTVKLPEIGCEILPGALGEMAAAVTRHAQTPPALAVLMALSAVALAAQRSYVVQPTDDPDYVEPLCLWALVGLQSGSRKTPVLNILLAPVHDWEERARKQLAPKVAERFAVRQVAEKRIETLKAAAAKEDDPAKRRKLQDELQKVKHEMPDALDLPRLVVGDVTPERTQQLLMENQGGLAIVSDEPAVLEVLAGAYGTGGAILDVFLKGYSASPVHVERQTRSAHLTYPTVTMALAIQTDILADLGTNRRFRDSGLLARMLFAVPPTTIGRRNPRQISIIDPAVKAAYARAIEALLNARMQQDVRPSALTFDPVAQELYFEFAEYIEAQMRPGQPLEPLSDWASKLPGQASRIAALLHLVADGPNRPVGAAAMSRAVQLCRWLVDHALHVFRLLGADQTEGDALALLRWVVREGHQQLYRSKAQKALEGRFRTVDRLKEACARLHEWNAISAELAQVNKHARPSPYYDVNPAVHAPGLFDFSRNS